MKRSIDVIVAKRYLQLFWHLALVVRCLKIGSSDLASSIGTKAINSDGLGRCAFDELFHGLITGYLKQPEPNLHKRSGERMRLAVLST